MDLSITISAKSAASDAELATLVEPAIRSLMGAMLTRAKRLVPKRTWRLHDTLSTEVTREGGVVVGVLSAGSSEVTYARFVELGTSRQKAQPYLRPALLQTHGRDLQGGAS